MGISSIGAKPASQSGNSSFQADARKLESLQKNRKQVAAEMDKVKKNKQMKEEIKQRKLDALQKRLDNIDQQIRQQQQKVQAVAAKAAEGQDKETIEQIEQLKELEQGTQNAEQAQQAAELEAIQGAAATAPVQQVSAAELDLEKLDPGRPEKYDRFVKDSLTPSASGRYWPYRDENGSLQLATDMKMPEKGLDAFQEQKEEEILFNQKDQDVQEELRRLGLHR